MKRIFPNIQYLIANIFLWLLMAVGFFYRIYGLNNNYSFWSDENVVAIFTRSILERGKPILANGYSTGIYQWLQYWLSALSAKIFGLNEFAIRFPSVVFGALTIWAVYLLGKELFNKNVGLAAASFTTFLKIEILWSRQARPYQALQFFFLLGAWFIYKLAKEEKFNWRYFMGFLGCGVLASLMHGLGLVIFFVGFVYFLIFKPSWFKKKWMLLGIILPVVLGWIFKIQIFSVISQIGKVNNLFYYRVFLWHNYSLLVFLVLVGFLFQIFQKKKSWQILILFLAIQGVIVSFFLPQPFTRYFYIVFPFFLLFSAVGLAEITQFLLPRRSQMFRSIILLFLAFFIIAMGNKFTLFPQRVYFLNEDMQEIPEVGWKKIYSYVEKNFKKDTDLILVTNWNDFPIWYLGEESNLRFILVRKKGQSNPKRDFAFGEKVIYSLEDFKLLIKTHKNGIAIFDSWDDQIADGVREYCQSNLRVEMEVDRLYSVQPRYWPVEVYSWGL